MDLKLFAVVFGTVFLAELGDKTQLATVLFASKPSASLLTVFVGASLALLVASGLAVAAGSLISQTINPRYLSYIAGVGFVVIGIWTITQAAIGD
jgi:putative Ca2+/H+ antiporter (TMEM165/GDT1 family)